MFCTSYFNSSSTSIRTFLLKVFHFNDYQMSFVADSPVNSSSSDDFAAFLDAELGGNSAESSPDEEAEDDDFKDEEAGDEEPEDEEARDEEAEDEEAGHDNDLNNKRIKRCKVEVLESIHKQGSASYATLEQQTEATANVDICTHPGSSGEICLQGLNSMLQMFTRKDSTEFHEFDAVFLGSQAHYEVTSVIGHVFRSIFFLIMLTKKGKSAIIFLVPGVEGGFDNNEAEYDDTHNIVILPDYVALPFPSVELPEKVRLAVDAILMAEGAERKDQLQHGQLIRSKPVHMQ
ncbi:hypothetical protein Pint_07195 [Pistacia integerrima]|uniref:Uncharacterized protein n=1 Tax=Pistacia integerrima TaxID=434235 RepID=A0ACC0XY36_9ROSI|nr:hypothetical protein Pint_07195 [Pistacia integerrima]